MLHAVLITALHFPQTTLWIGSVLWSPGLPALPVPQGPPVVRYQLAEQLFVISCLSGCEFFKEYKDRDYTAEGLIFNWKQVQNGELKALLSS